MGDLIILADRIATRSRPASCRPAFFFDLACPFSYLAAERIERFIGEVEWVPVSGASLPSGSGSPRTPQLIQRAENRAAELRLPIVWPDYRPEGTPSALRATAYASEVGAGAPFALAASRLAFCGGFDLEDPEVLAEAAAAAGIPLEACLAAARDASWDDALQTTGHGLTSRLITELPAFRVDRRFVQGERALGEAAALLRALAAEGRPLAPVG